MTASEPNPITSQIRAMIQWAYSEQAGVDGSIFEMFSGRRVKQAKLKPSRRYEGLSPTRIHATESAKQGKARIPIASGRSGGEIKRAVASLPPVEQNWIHHCYNPSRDRKHSATKTLYPALWAIYKEEGGLKGSHSKSTILTMFMLKIQLQHTRTYPGLQRWNESRPEEMATVITQPSWTDTHKRRWIAVHELITRTDHRALMAMYHQMQKKSIEIAE